MSFLFVHSLSEDKLIKSLDLGGFPLPSVAVIKPDTEFNSFGNITFIIKPEVLDPKDKKNVFYDRDIFSQRIPETEYIIDKKQLGKVIDDIYLKTNGFEKFYNFNDADSLKRKNSGYIQERFESSMLLKKEYFLNSNKHYEIPLKKSKLKSILSENKEFANYIKNNNIEPNEEFKKVILSSLKERELHYQSLLGHEITKSIIDDIKNDLFIENTENFKINDYTSKYNDSFKSFEKDKIILSGQINEVDFDKFQNDINDFTFKNMKDFKEFLSINYLSSFCSSPHFKIGTKKYDYNLENIEKLMKKQQVIGVEDTSDTSIGKMSSYFAKQLNSFQEIEENLFLLKEKTERFDKKDLLNKKIFNICSELEDFHSSKRFFDIQESLCIALKQGRNKDSLIKALKNNYFDVSKIKDSTLEDCINVVKELINLDNHYFEGKPQKTIYLEDCSAVLLPIGINKDIINKLKDKVKIHFYDKDNLESKIEIFEKYKVEISKINEKKIKRPLTIK